MTLTQENQTPETHIIPPPPTGWEYASFSSRALAFSIDQFFLIFILFVFALPVTLLLGLGTMIAWPFVTFFILPPVLPVTTIIAWIYFAMQESGRHRGTFGKRICGLAVIEDSGKRLTFIRATVRFFAKFISGAFMLLGFIMAAFTERHQALHDYVAETLVVKKAKVKN